MTFFLCSRQSPNSFVFFLHEKEPVLPDGHSKSPIMDQKLLKISQKKRHNTSGKNLAGNKKNLQIIWYFVVSCLLFTFVLAANSMHSRFHADAECHSGQQNEEEKKYFVNLKK